MCAAAALPLGLRVCAAAHHLPDPGHAARGHLAGRYRAQGLVRAACGRRTCSCLRSHLGPAKRGCCACRHLYPQWPAVDMVAYMKDCLDAQGVDLMLQMLRYDPDARISVRCCAASRSSAGNESVLHAVLHTAEQFAAFWPCTCGACVALRGGQCAGEAGAEAPVVRRPRHGGHERSREPRRAARPCRGIVVPLRTQGCLREPYGAVLLLGRLDGPWRREWRGFRA